MGAVVPEGGAQLEHEWQLEGDLWSAERWLAFPPPGFTTIPSHEEELRDRYYEAPPWSLARAGFTCRVRVSRSGSVLTLKGFGETIGGARVRPELHQPLPDGDAVPWPEGPVVRALADLGLLHGLTPLFELHTLRRSWQVMLDGEPAAEVCVDRCQLRDNDGTAIGAFARVEVEALGRLDAAARVADALIGVGLTPAGASKFVTACRLLGMGLPVSE